MSRIGKLPVPVPSGVDIALDESVVTVKGPKGTLSHTVAEPITVSAVRGPRGQASDDEREPCCTA
jgi:large subunit ribosomal protein L6